MRLKAFEKHDRRLTPCATANALKIERYKGQVADYIVLYRVCHIGLMIGTGAFGVVLPPDAAEGDCLDLLFNWEGVGGEYFFRLEAGEADCCLGVFW